jgi:hypothetical protein
MSGKFIGCITDMIDPLAVEIPRVVIMRFFCVEPCLSLWLTFSSQHGDGNLHFPSTCMGGLPDGG